MEIKVGEYVRTYNGIIGRVFNITEIGQGVRYAGEFITDEIISIYTDKVGEIRLKRKEIIKHSFNIIDLIEVGDFVNENEVIDKYLFNGEIPVLETTGDETNAKCMCEGDIKTILTHEQYERNCYRLEDN